MTGETVDMENFGTNTVSAENAIVVVQPAFTHARTHTTLITPQRTTIHLSWNVSLSETHCLLLHVGIKSFQLRKTTRIY